jgi:hypothetical protein
MIERVVGGTPDLKTLDRGEVRARLGDEAGPDRIVDLLVRSGPYGDGFGARPGGLTLADIKNAPHGLDLGPMTPGRLAAMLRTPDAKVHLVPAPLAEEVSRLEAELEQPAKGRGYLLISRRDVRSNLSWMHNLPPLCPSGGCGHTRAAGRRAGAAQLERRRDRRQGRDHRSSDAGRGVHAVRLGP